MSSFDTKIYCIRVCVCEKVIVVITYFTAQEDAEDVAIGEREHATALVMACRHLPQQLLSSPGQRTAMLTEAAKKYERLGDKKGLLDCRTLMMKYGQNVASNAGPIPVQC